MTDKERELLARTWKGEKCIICEFEIDQVELDEVVERPEGLCHTRCLEEQDEAEDSEINNHKLEI